MDWLNYHHLLYFWMVAREGSLAAASAELRLAQSTISGQIRALEESLGQQLFARSGRRQVLTETGRVVYGYAEEIFTLGRELRESVGGRSGARVMTLAVGVADVVPKLVAMRLLEPALNLPEPVRLVCREDKPERLLAGLAAHHLDVVLADAPVAPARPIRAYNHLLGECGVVFVATAKLAAAHRPNFPRSLNGAPVILPTENTTLRRALEQWFASRRLRPSVIGEFEDSALMKVFGQAGLGLFPVSAVILDEVVRQYQVEVVGELDEVRERFYAVSVDRKLKHPAVIAVCAEARQKLFG